MNDLTTPDPGDTTLREALADADVYRTLLESTRAIPWKIDWASMRFAYIGPQIEALLGWPQASWSTVEDWAARMHPEDRERVVGFCVAQSEAGVDHEADYRAMAQDGRHVWIRDVVHVVRRPDGGVDSLVGFMFDISERKKDEEERLRLHRELERLSMTDGLTGIANRRMFDTRLGTEWKAAREGGAPLSLLIVDIDYFKQYNDAHGHVAGDECLKRVGGMLHELSQRPGDVVARFGGEEFILLLPGADEAAAREVAEACVRGIARLRIPHGGSDVSDIVTASLGVGTARPAGGDTARDFLAAVDRRLYDAKDRGRDRIEVLE